MSSAERLRTPARITILRNATDDTQTRQIKVYLDGQNRGELMYGDSLALDVPPGAHVLGVDNTWNRKDLALEVHPGHDLRFLTKSSAGKFVWFLLGFFGAGPMHVSIEPLPLATTDGEPGIVTIRSRSKTRNRRFAI